MARCHDDRCLHRIWGLPRGAAGANRREDSYRIEKDARKAKANILIATTTLSVGGTAHRRIQSMSARESRATFPSVRVVYGRWIPFGRVKSTEQMLMLLLVLCFWFCTKVCFPHLFLSLLTVRVIHLMPSSSVDSCCARTSACNETQLLLPSTIFFLQL